MRWSKLQRDLAKDQTAVAKAAQSIQYIHVVTSGHVVAHEFMVFFVWEIVVS
jgi:hypothetical protein